MKLFTLLFLISTTIVAQEIVDQTINTQVEASNVSIEIQNKIDELDIESKKIYFDYKDTLNEFNSLKNYDDQLSKIIDAQIIEISSINEQLDSLDSINIDILPLLKRMVDSLDLVKIPFSNILEFGVNDNIVNNYLLNKFPKSNITKSDITDIKNINYDLDTFLKINLENLKLKKEFYDLIYSNFFLHLSNNFESNLKILHESLKSNGFLLAAIPDSDII